MKPINWDKYQMEITREVLRKRILEENEQIRKISNGSENRARTRKSKDLLVRLKQANQ